LNFLSISIGYTLAEVARMAASHKKIEIEGTEIFHFEKDKINEGWTIFNMAELAK
jgi:hypothetical protein